MRKYTVQFYRVPIGCKFSQNGNACVKRSTRTATLPEYGRRFYFRRREQVTVSVAVRDAILRDELQA